MDAPDEALHASYRRCRDLNRRHGTTYYWSTQLLPRGSRRHVHALYGFCRYADDLVDDLVVAGDDHTARREALAHLGAELAAGLAAGRSAHPVLMAVVHTATTFGIAPACFERFLASMAMDLSVATYATYDDLVAYMDGSAAVIGEMMLPILQPTSPDAAGPARDLGLAFQLTNFLRDVAEDLDRGRVYLPQEEIARFGAADALLTRTVTDGWVRLAQFEIDRARALYRAADRGIPLLPPAAARCIRSARVLYSGILDAIEEAKYDVFSARRGVPRWRKAWTVARAALVRPGPLEGGSILV